jgi:predicted TPR repeat methyltransferase
MNDPAAKLHAVTLEEAMAMAIAFQQRGQLDEAERVYRKVFEVVPDHAGALHYAGVLAHQQGRSEDGIALIQRSLAIEPNQPDCYSNLGIVLRALGRLDDAAAAYRHAIALDPDQANAYSNLGIILRAQGSVVDAEAAYRTAIQLNPNHIDAYHNLGVLLSSLKRTKEAVICYCKVTTLSPRHPEARRLLALAYRTLGEHDKATEIFEEWLAEEPDNPVARHMLAACSGREVPQRASDAYVEKVFDDFASSFDSKLAHLSYQAPQLVAAMLADSGLQPTKSLDILDAGCGTGLCGPLIAPYARRLVGVDLSGRMLARAREKGVYDELVKAELTAYVRQFREAFDVIVSADTLVYFGGLEDVFAAASVALRPEGMLIFSVEEAAVPVTTYCIESHGRYGHARSYVEAALSEAGFDTEIVCAELRMESGSPVEGLVVRGTRRP